MNWHSLVLTHLIFSQIVLAGPTNEVSHVVDGGGNRTSNNSFTDYASISQPSPPGFSSNSKFLNSGGFLQSDTLTAQKSSDSDNDGLSDWDELTGQLSDPASPSSVLLSDTDGDGVSDQQEILSGTNPLDPENYLALVYLGGLQGVDIGWQARAGRSYRLFCSDSITGLATNPTLLSEGVASGGSGPWSTTYMFHTNDIPSGVQRYYKVQTP